MKTVELDDLVKAKNPHTWRNDCGKGWVSGQPLILKQDATIVTDKGVKHLKEHQLVVVGPSKISYGLQPGSGDRVGFTPIKITPDMVGKTIPVFTSIEEKNEGDNLSDKQKNWHKMVLDAGGISEIWYIKKGELCVETKREV